MAPSFVRIFLLILLIVIFMGFFKFILGFEKFILSNRKDIIDLLLSLLHTTKNNLVKIHFSLFCIADKDSFWKTSSVLGIEARALNSSAYTPSARAIRIARVLVAVLSFAFIRSFT